MRGNDFQSTVLYSFDAKSNCTGFYRSMNNPCRLHEERVPIYVIRSGTESKTKPLELLSPSKYAVEATLIKTFNFNVYNVYLGFTTILRVFVLLFEPVANRHAC